MTFEMTLVQFLLLYQIKLLVTTTIPIELEQPKDNNKKVNLVEKKPYYRILGCYTILKQ